MTERDADSRIFLESRIRSENASWQLTGDESEDRFVGQAFPVRALRKSGPPIAVTLAGPLCTSLDRLGDVQLPALQSGDVVIFGTTGSYGFSEGMTHFLSHPIPAEIWVGD